MIAVQAVEPAHARPPRPGRLASNAAPNPDFAAPALRAAVAVRRAAAPRGLPRAGAAGRAGGPAGAAAGDRVGVAPAAPRARRAGRLPGPVPGRGGDRRGRLVPVGRG